MVVRKINSIAWVASAVAAYGAFGAIGQSRAATSESSQDVAADWPNNGRTADEQRFSPLRGINASNVGRLGLAWYSDLDTARGQEATPIVVGGVLYVSTAWSKVKAFEAATGKPLWQYDPKVPPETLAKACCDAINRGVAFWHGRIYVGTLDGRLVALDAKTGKALFDVPTIPVGSQYTITGAPRIVKGRVVIGNGGAEYSARGYVSAYDTLTGALVWRFYTVPGNPSLPFEQPELASAAKTWTGEWWKVGGGGTVWDSMTYDPQTDLLYFGTANGEPWNASLRSPEGGDNLFTSSIIAVNPDTGQYVWHFQETPQDRWDFDSTQQIIAVTLPVGGKSTRVLMHAPKNGFFYLFDAKTGKFLSGKPFAKVTWAKGLDPVTGKPDIVPEAFYDLTKRTFVGSPGALGAHSWEPMSYSPMTKLVYIPVNEAAFAYAAAEEHWQPTTQGFNVGIDYAKVAMPADSAVRAAAASATTGKLVAWNPLTQSIVWSVPRIGPANGGTLATAGNLVFEGTAAGTFEAYAADSGKKLWSTPTQTGVIAAPMTYSVAGVQYVAVMAGWGGAFDLAAGAIAGKSGTTRNISRLLVYKVGGKIALPTVNETKALPLDPPPVAGTAAQAAEGAGYYARFCNMCHGDAAIAGGVHPDLRRSAALNSEAAWQAIVHDGVLAKGGMVSWSAVMSPTQVETIRLYVIKRANEDKALNSVGGAQH
jgi:quinohemoprotein ethanol dehydrogenase